MKPTNFVFVELDEDTIKSRLVEILIRRGSKSAQLRNLLQYHLQGILRKIDCPVQFFWYTALEPEQTCIVGKLMNRFHNEIQWIILAPVALERDAMLAFSEIVDWDKHITFNSVDVAILPYLREQCEAQGGTDCSFEPGFVQDMRLEHALQLHVSDEELQHGRIEIKPLALEEVPVVMKHWKFADHNEGEVIKHSILHIPSAALHVDGKLVSWGFTSIEGGIHAVHTLEEYRGRGYGHILLKYHCRKLAEAGIIPLVHIEVGNDVSKRIMDRVGFQYSHDMSWTIYHPPEQKY